VLIEEAHESQATQGGGRDGLVHVAGARVPPGTAAVHRRVGGPAGVQGRSRALPREACRPAMSYRRGQIPDHVGHTSASTRPERLPEGGLEPADRFLGHLQPTRPRDGSAWQAGRPPGVRHVTVPARPPRLRRRVPGDIGLWVSWPLRPRDAASYAVLVHRAAGLPAASFPQRLATPQLPFG